MVDGRNEKFSVVPVPYDTRFTTDVTSNFLFWFKWGFFNMILGLFASLFFGLTALGCEIDLTIAELVGALLSSI